MAIDMKNNKTPKNIGFFGSFNLPFDIKNYKELRPFPDEYWECAACMP